jgi:pyruvate/2-oxoglutarate dehydrogenase complex dihydrolipoamide dehydrogenase (E3) component
LTGIFMAEILRPDLCVLGAGAGGIAAAYAAAAAGARVVLVERRRLDDGHPSPALAMHVLIEASRMAAAWQSTTSPGKASFGLASDLAPFKSVVDIAALRTRAQTLASRLALDSPIRLDALRIRTIQGTVRFTGKTRCEAAGFTIEPKWFVIAPGAAPAPITGIKRFEFVRPLEPQAFLDLEAWPKRLVLLGGSGHGLALAQAFRRLGSEVHLLEPGIFLPGEDRELVTPILTRLQREGVELHENTAVERVEPHLSGLRIGAVQAGCDLQLEASHLMLTTPPMPLVEGLGLSEAGVDYDKNGIKVRADLRTSNPNIYAIGDVLGGTQSLGSARSQGRRVVAHIFKIKPFFKTRHSGAPQTTRSVFTDPEFAAVGLSESEAQKSHRDIRVLRARFHDNFAAELAGESDGHVKLITDARDRLLGVGIVGPQAREMIALYALALSQGLRAGDLRGFVPATPSLSEAGSLAALALPGQLGKALWRRIFPVPRRFR